MDRGLLFLVDGEGQPFYLRSSERKPEDITETEPLESVSVLDFSLDKF
jgi:hypothetical protein